MTIGAFVLDFDGHLTLTERESEPVRAAFKDAVKTICGYTAAELERGWERIGQLIKEHPEDFGWDYNGMRVAPVADAYIEATTIATELLKDALPDAGERFAVLQKLYGMHYSHIPHFREGAAELLESIYQSGIPAYVVTNSNPASVEAKIRQLGPFPLPVLGDAKKYEAADTERLFIEGLARPVLLERPRYRATLEKISHQTGVSPERFCVLGDIFELDLALPLHLGSIGVLLSTSYTPRYEQSHLASHPRGMLAQNLAAEVALVRGLP